MRGIDKMTLQYCTIVRGFMAREALDTAREVFKNIEANMLPAITSSTSKTMT